MNRFYVSKENVRKDEIIVQGKEAHHILDVLRLQENDKVIIFDGTGNEYIGFIDSRGKDNKGRNKKLIVKIVRTESPPKEAIPEIVLAQAIPKKGKMDYIVEKATELGVSIVVPVVTERTITRPNDDMHSKKMVERWQKIAIEASKQCQRLTIPVINKITDFGEVTNHISQYDLAILASLAGKTVSVKESLTDFKSGKILVFIGPEGDFTPEETRMADKDNCRFVSLGKRVLKSDTAALFMLSVLNYEFMEA